MSQIVGEVQESIKEEITCRICLELMEDPRALPCTHVYCKACLQRAHNRCQSLSTTLTCPECRREAQISGNNVESLSRDFRTVRLRTVYDRLLSQQTDATVSESEATFNRDAGFESEKTAAMCAIHHRSLTGYCITCRDVVCQECENDHTNHNYHHIIKENVIHKQFNPKLDPLTTEINLPYGKKLTSSLIKPNDVPKRIIDPMTQKKLDTISSAVREIEPKLSEALVEATKVHSEVEHQARECHIQVDAIFEGMIRLLNEKRQHLHREIDQELTKKRNALTPQKEQLTTTYRELVTVADKCHSGEVRDQGSASQLLLTFQRVSDRAKQLSLKPAEVADIGKCLTKDTVTKSCCKSCMFKVRIPDMNKCQVAGNFLKHPETTDRQFFLSLRVCEANGQLSASRYNQVEGELVCTRDKSKNIATILCVEKGIFHLLFARAERGRHVLNIRVNHLLISQCPISLFVEKKPQTYSAPINQIENLNGPTGLQILKQNLVVSEEYSFTVSTYHESGKRTRSLEMGGEYAADIESEEYFVANAISHEIFKFNAKGLHHKRVGTQGREPGQFQNPGGMDFYDGELFVTDSANHRIQVFDRDLNLIRHFGQEGVKNGCFNYPRDVVVDSKGDLYITDMLNNRIQVLTKNGLFIRNINKQIKQRIYPHTPCKIQIHREFLFITEHHINSVCVFTKSGDFVTTFGETYLVNPDGIAVSEDGYVYVSSNKEKILVF